MNTSTQQIENNKNFESELRFIDKLNSLDKFEVDILESNGAKACLSKLPETFKLEINARLIEDDTLSFAKSAQYRCCPVRVLFHPY